MSRGSTGGAAAVTGVRRASETGRERGRIERLFEKKGHEFIEADLLLIANGSRPVASISHTAIYLLRKAG